MKSAQISNYGDTEEIKIVETPPPSPKQSQVQIEVYAASLNPFDFKLLSGYMKDKIPLTFPVVLGGDFAGIITNGANDEGGYKKGDEVFGSALILNGGSGSFAEIVSANTANIALKGRSIDFIESSSLPLVGSSAIQALNEHIKLQPGQKILIHGGAGGIGSIAIQLGKALGAYVTTTVSTNDLEFVQSLGVDQVIDYKTQKFEEILKDYDAVFDTVGGKTTDNSFKVLKKNGIIVSMVGKPDAEMANKYGVTAIGQGTEITSKHLSELSNLVENGKIKPQVDKIFMLDQIKEAFDYLKKESPRGKVVLNIKS